MSLHDRAGFEALVGALPGTSTHAQWEALVAKVGGKVFCLLGDESGALVFRVSELAFDGLIELDGIAQAAYFAKRAWVRVLPGALEEALLEGYIRESYRQIAAKLTRKLRTELGISV